MLLNMRKVLYQEIINPGIILQKKIEKMNNIILELEDQVTADNIINDIIDYNCANAIMWIAPVCAYKHYKIEIIKNMLLAYSGDNKLGILALNAAMLLKTL